MAIAKPAISWNLFPTELWRIVLDYIHNQETPYNNTLKSRHDPQVIQKDLAAISLISRRLHRIVEPYLYTELSWIPKPESTLPSLRHQSINKDSTEETV